MKDDLKNFTEQHRQKFEHYKLDVDETWRAIEHSLNDLEQKQERVPWKIIMKAAAVLIIIMAVSFGYYMNNQRIALNKNGMALHNISADLADAEAFYVARIDEKLESIKMVTGDLDSAVLEQLKIMDEDYSSLKDDVLDNADSEEVINAMVEYYRRKLAMLENILEEIQKKDVKDHDEMQAI